MQKFHMEMVQFICVMSHLDEPASEEGAHVMNAGEAGVESEFSVSMLSIIPESKAKLEVVPSTEKYQNTKKVQQM